MFWFYTWSVLFQLWLETYLSRLAAEEWCLICHKFSNFLAVQLDGDKSSARSCRTRVASMHNYHVDISISLIGITSKSTKFRTFHLTQRAMVETREKIHFSHPSDWDLFSFLFSRLESAASNQLRYHLLQVSGLHDMWWRLVSSWHCNTSPLKSWQLSFSALRRSSSIATALHGTVQCL